MRSAGLPSRTSATASLSPSSDNAGGPAGHCRNPVRDNHKSRLEHSHRVSGSRPNPNPRSIRSSDPRQHAHSLPPNQSRGRCSSRHPSHGRRRTCPGCTGGCACLDVFAGDPPGRLRRRITDAASTSHQDSVSASGRGGRSLRSEGPRNGRETPHPAGRTPSRPHSASARAA